MNYSRLALAALGGAVASFAFGFLVFWLVPGLIKEAHKYPAVFRPKEEMKTVMPIGIVATFMAILVVAIIVAMIHQGGSGTTEGALRRSYWLVVVCAFVLHDYLNLNIGLKLALGQAVAYFVQWTIIGIVIGLIWGHYTKGQESYANGFFTLQLPLLPNRRQSDDMRQWGI
jgi:hypothetical protein